MMTWRKVGRLGALGILSLAVLNACGYAKRKDVDAQMMQLRTQLQEEMRAGDAAVDGRVTLLGTRVDQLGAGVEGLQRELAALRNDFDTRIASMDDLLAFSVPVHFGFDDAAVREQDRAVLTRFAGVVRRYYPDAVVTVEGFTDPIGPASYNMKLGKRRAESVRAYLAESGLDGRNLRTVSYGETPSRLVVRNGGKTLGERNRRVVLVIDSRGESRDKVVANGGQR